MNFLERIFTKRKFQKKADRRAILTISFKPDEELPFGVWNYLVKRRAEFRCEDCGKPECHTKAHHITRPEDGGKNILRNGRCLCDSCHGFYSWNNKKIREHENEVEYKLIRSFGKEKGKEIFQKYLLCNSPKKRKLFFEELAERYPTETSKYFGIL